MNNYARQPCGVGVHRRLQNAERDHVVCLLRLIERLPMLSEAAGADLETLRRQLETIHRNHVELSQMATVFLSPAAVEPEHH